MQNKRVVVAMSGGVDSSVAAALLKSQGYEVIGITMCFNLADSSKKKPACCGLAGIEDARRVAYQLGIKHYVINMQKFLQEHVISDFCQEYIKGRTPNPCIRCNQHLKFGMLLKKALSLDARFLATGHYARITRSPSHHIFRSPVYFLKKAKDKFKDQSYFLYRINQAQLKHVLFPLGNYTKDEVRQLARKFDLSVADKVASQEICFLPGMDYRPFLKAQIGAQIKPGQIIDTAGNVLGGHKGIAYYTVGQREGLGIAKGYPIYITKIDVRNNRIIVGNKEEACNSEFLAGNLHFIGASIKNKVALSIKIRYNHKESSAELEPMKNRHCRGSDRGRNVQDSAEPSVARPILRIKFKKPQFAITPGQSAVFYDKDKVVGGGIIEEIIG